MGVFIEYYAVNEQNAFFNHCAPTEMKFLLHGKVVSLPIISKGKYSCIVKVDSVTADQCVRTLVHKNILCFSEEEPPAYGAVEMTGRFRPPRINENSGNGFNEYLYYMSNNLWGVFYSNSIHHRTASSFFLSQWALDIRSLVKTSLSYIRNEEYRGILAASFLNEKNELSENMKTLFLNAGIYHLLALSGFNIAVLAGMIYALLLFLPMKKESKIIIALVALWLYLLFIGMIPSLFRAVVMTTIVGVSFIFQKKNFLLNTLGIAGIMWLIMSPMSLFTPSYQLSFTATLGLITLSPLILDYCRLPPMNAILRMFLQSIFSIAAVSIASFIATVPVLIYHFNQLYLFGLFANLFTVLLMAIAMWFAFAGFILQIFVPQLSALCMHGAEGLIYIMMQGAGLVEFVPWSIIRFSLPYPEIYAIFSFCFLGFILIKKEFRLRFSAVAFPAGLLLSLLFIWLHRAGSEAQVSFLEMKNSRLAAIKWPNNRAWIIDIGPDMPPAWTYRQYVSAWQNQFMGCGIDKIILPRWKNDAVHFLEPIFKNEKNANIICCDSAYAHDDDFTSFVRSFNRSIFYYQTRDSIKIWDKCSCRIISMLNEKNKGLKAFILKIYGSAVFIPDSKSLQADMKPYSMTIGKRRVKVSG